FAVERMELDVVLDVLEVDEAADLAVGIAGDVDEDGVDVGLFVEAVERGDGEELLQRPVIEEGLEDGKIADVLVGEEGVEVVKFLRLVAGLAILLRDLLADLPENLLGGGAVFQIEVAEVEERKGLFFFLERVVETLEQAEPGLVLEQDGEVVDDLVGLLRLVLLAERLALVDPLEDFDHEHGVGADDVEVTHGEAHFRELAVEAAGLDDGVLDRDDVGDLRADVKMDEAEGGGELGRFELFTGKENFRGVEAELGIVTGGHGPLSLAAGLELGAEADHGLHPGLGGEADDVVELGELLDDEDDLFAELAADEGEADVVEVLVAVANDEALGALMHGEGDHELGLGAGLEAVIVVL